MAVVPLFDFDSSESYGPLAPIIATQAPWAPNLRSGHLLPDFGGGVGWDADRRLRMRNAGLLTLSLIEATLIWITRRLRRFANVR